jgi:hypothetical protein
VPFTNSGHLAKLKSQSVARSSTARRGATLSARRDPYPACLARPVFRSLEAQLDGLTFGVGDDGVGAGVAAPFAGGAGFAFRTRYFYTRADDGYASDHEKRR